MFVERWAEKVERSAFSVERETTRDIQSHAAIAESSLDHFSQRALDAVRSTLNAQR
jgi:hypothetical protein